MNVLIMAAALLGSVAAAPTETQQAAEKPIVRTAKADILTCRKQRETGSNLVKRVCSTERQRAEAKERANIELQKLGDCSGVDSTCYGDL